MARAVRKRKPAARKPAEPPISDDVAVLQQSVRALREVIAKAERAIRLEGGCSTTRRLITEARFAAGLPVPKAGKVCVTVEVPSGVMDQDGGLDSDDNWAASLVYKGRPVEAAVKVMDSYYD